MSADAQSFDAELNDAVRRKERHDLSPTDGDGEPVRYRKPFADRKQADQWCCIREWMQANGHGNEVLAEAHQFHPHCNAIAAARFAGDHDTASRLIEEAQREYLGQLVQDDWNQEDEDEHDVDIQ